MEGHQHHPAWDSGGTNNFHPNATEEVSDLPVGYPEAIFVKTVASESCLILDAWLWIEVVVVRELQLHIFGG